MSEMRSSTSELHAGFVPEFDALYRGSPYWELDTADARMFVGAGPSGREPQADWVGEVLGRSRVVGLNERAAHLVGAPAGREEMIGRPIADFWPPDSQDDLAELIADVATDRSPRVIRTRDIGSLLLQDPVLTVWRSHETGADTVFVAVRGAVNDRRSYWSLRASEERYRKLIHHIPNPLLRVDARAMGRVFARLKAEGVNDLDSYLDAHPELLAFAEQSVRITEINRAAALLFGATSATDLVGPVKCLLQASPETTRRVMVAQFDGRRSHAEVMKLCTLDGRLLDVQLAVTFPTPPEQLDVTVISLDDLTDRLRTEAQLRQLQADFTRAARISTLGELATSIAHEVNQPLAAIFTNAETSLRWLARDEPNLAKVVQLTTRIAASARHATEIVQRIRAMTAKHAPERRPLELNEVVDEALLFLRHDIETRSIRLSARLGLGLPRVIGDRVQLQQVIVNLLVNSAQAIGQAGAKGGLVELSTGLSEAGEVVFVIRDNGPGIPAEDLDRIFEGFFTTKDEGMGLGLAICQSIMTAHGGGIVASNRPEGGACFRLWLPAEPIAAQGWETRPL
ncbi:signal transduction histidine kinase [Inquilinus ginsengisoli]|uniref:histidine kinase n=1 Tax=Inquilinus ginsengisoli TaxID=363840 RepID=A0ABU1JIH0_9PROT|nr:ATP-binding protein [Inquilinus ginsengisoli]MDR6288388.1 signal transduction histidine kinase [Inquilinus ginsengisoli]